MLFGYCGDGGVVMAMAWSCAMSHQMTARAAAYVLPDPYGAWTATRSWLRRALRICCCSCRRVTPSRWMANHSGRLRHLARSRGVVVGMCFVLTHALWGCLDGGGRVGGMG